MIVGEDAIERWMCVPAGIPEASRCALMILVSHDVFTRKVADFYVDFYGELEEVGEAAPPNVEILFDFLYKAESEDEQA